MKKYIKKIISRFPLSHIHCNSQRKRQNSVFELKKTCEEICYDVESKNGVYWSSSHL